MIHQMTKGALISIIGIGLNAASALAGAITYHPENAVIGGGLGCPQSQTRIYADEFGGIAIEHDALAILMDASTPLLAERKACAIRIPITLQRGYYVRAIEQRLSFGISKTEGSEARLATRTSIGGIAVNPFSIVLPFGDEIYSEHMIESRRDLVGIAGNRARFCSPERSELQVLQINIAMTAQRNSIYDELILLSNGTYINEGLEIEVAPCL